MNQDLMELFQEINLFFLPKEMKDRTYVINLDEFANVGIYWVAFFCSRNEIVYFDGFGVEHVPDKIKGFIGNENIKANIFFITSKQFSNVWLLLHYWIH